MWVSPRYRIVAGIPVRPLFDDPQLRQSYITPHFRKCRAVVPLKLHLVPRTASRPHGFPKQALCKIAFAGAVASRLHSPVSSRPTCSRLSPLWCAGVVACFRRFAHGFSQRLRRVSCVCPAHPWGLLASQHRPRGLPVRPRGAPSEPRSQLVNFCYVFASTLRAEYEHNGTSR